ncbi:hypothetical protein Pint_29103 [Pistacia integerrima]|uniref:Uncharacterized protein n=1 Tax=Pistacia integerrima TaxID=434235 RepID=A0ACC0WYU9_9ROSI|nr:hypothetical protein Pint_29103 [Pistacia integerrima]
MAAEITILLVKEKLENLLASTKIGDPSLLTQVNESIAKLEESLETWKNLEDDQGSHLTIDDRKIVLLAAVYDAEDTIDAFLACTTLQKQKSFPLFPLRSEHSQSRASRKMRNFVDHLTSFIENKSVHVEPTNVEDMPVLKLENKNFGEGTSKSNYGEGASGSKFSYEDDTCGLVDTAQTEHNHVKSRVLSTNSVEDIQVQRSEEKHFVDGKLEKIEEKLVEDETGVDKHTHLEKIEEVEEMDEERKRAGEHIQQGEIEEEGVGKEENRGTVNAASYSKQGEDQSISSNESVSSDNLRASDIFSLGYRDLNSPLRACLQYLCLFPRSDPIPIRRLARLWIAEGLVKVSTNYNKEPEDLVEEYLQQLEQRNMIKIAKSDGRPKTCSVEGLFYDLLCPNAKLVGFVYVHPTSGPESKSSAKLGIRRLVEQVDIQNNPPSDEDIQQLRSYISFNKVEGKKAAEGVGNLLKRTITKRGFGLLTLLDLERVYKPVLLPKTLRRLPLLKYLGLRRTFLNEVPKSVGDIPFLDTLDVKHTYITELPNSIFNAKKLLHLYINGIDFATSKQISSSSLNNLQTLSGLFLGKNSPTINWLTKLTCLKKLRLTCHNESIVGITICLSTQTSLHSLRLRSVDDNGEPSKLKWISNKMLTDLYLMGELPQGFKVSLEQLPSKLRVLTLSVSKLSEDPMPALGQLENLRILRLYANSYLGEKMICGPAGRFSKLEVLKLWMLLNLREWRIEGAMPVLKELEIRYCRKLQKPTGLEGLTTLEKLTLTNMKENFVTEVRESIGYKTQVIENNWSFIHSWESIEEQQQELRQKSKQRDGAPIESSEEQQQENREVGAFQSINKSPIVRSNTLKHRAPSRQLSRHLST